MDQLRDMCQVEGGQLFYERLIVPHLGCVQISKSSDRSVIGSMNDMIRLAEHWPDASPFDVGLRLNKVPFRRIGMKYPREAFLAMKMDGADE